MNIPTAVNFEVNGRAYHVPASPLAVICIDGCADEYLSVSIAQGQMPNVARMAACGYRGLVRGALPSFTNVNNCAIVTGTPPCTTGISGNYIIDPVSGGEVMTNHSRFLRNDTILAAAARAGRLVAMVTAKDKLRELLSKGLNGIAFSAEKAHEANLAQHGIPDLSSLVGPTPDIYSGNASVYVLKAGAALMGHGFADFCYLTLTDYMQHAYAPEARESLEFYASLDREIGKLLEMGAVVAITADHGMNAKTAPDGSPNVVYLEESLESQFGQGIRVICPITDPYVVHHGALGSAVTVYLPAGVDRNTVARWILEIEGITEVYDREMAALKLELPPDRIGDLFVLAARNVVIGRSRGHHDIGKLAHTLRSHGGRYEEMVPLILSRRLNSEYAAKAAGDPRNFDVFDFTCNGGQG